MPKRTRVVIGGVDTHGRTHHAAVIDHTGRLLGDRQFPADRVGYRQLLAGCVATGSCARLEAPAATAPG
jgi:transposase